MPDINLKYNDLPLTNFPESEDNWARMSDLSASLLAVAKQYENLYGAGDITSANNLLNQYPDLKDALFTPERWNELRDAIISLERFFLTDVDAMITHVTQATIGIDNNATGSDANINAYSVAKVNELLSTITTVKTATFTAAGWTSTLPYMQTVNVAGVTSSDRAVISIYIPIGTTVDNVRLQNKAYGRIDIIDSGNGTVTAYCCSKKPAVNFQIQIKGV